MTPPNQDSQTKLRLEEEIPPTTLYSIGTRLNLTATQPNANHRAMNFEIEITKHIQVAQGFQTQTFIVKIPTLKGKNTFFAKFFDPSYSDLHHYFEPSDTDAKRCS